MGLRSSALHPLLTATHETWDRASVRDLGTIVQRLGGLRQSASAQLTFSGSASQRLVGLRQSASGLLTFSAHAAQRVGKLIQSAAANVRLASPTELSDLKLWLRSDLGVTTSGSNVTAWADQSGSANNATGPASHQPTLNATDAGYNNRPTIQFASASSQYMTLGSPTPNQPCTLYVVGESTSGSGLQYFNGNANGACTILINTGSSIDWSINALTTRSSSNSTQGTAQAFAAVFNGASSSFYINSSATNLISGSPGTLDPATTSYVGTDNNTTGFLNGKIAEMVVCNTAHSTQTISEVFRYFGNLYSQSWS